jgi:hypothetical protein
MKNSNLKKLTRKAARKINGGGLQKCHYHFECPGGSCCQNVCVYYNCPGSLTQKDYYEKSKKLTRKEQEKINGAALVQCTKNSHCFGGYCCNYACYMYACIEP